AAAERGPEDVEEQSHPPIVSGIGRATRAAIAAAVALVTLAGLGSCSWAELFAPPRLDGGDGLVYQARVGPGPASPVEIFLDEHGVPHIYAERDEDLAYGLGFVHARDRLFQILVLKHAATGRLGELFGRGLVEE